MKQLHLLFGDFIKGKSIYAPIARILNVLFSFSITSVLFKKFVFAYQWNDFTDYKSHIDFFISGLFVVPLILFLLTHYGLYSIFYSIFSLTTAYKSNSISKIILATRVKTNNLKSIVKQVNNIPMIPLPEKIDAEVCMKYYDSIKNSVSEEQWEKARVSGKQIQQNIERNLILLCKAIVTVTMYFFTLEHFSVVLYLLTVITLLAFIIGLWSANIGIEVMPTIIRKIGFEFEKYKQENQVVEPKTA